MLRQTQHDKPEESPQPPLQGGEKIKKELFTLRLLGDGFGGFFGGFFIAEIIMLDGF